MADKCVVRNAQYRRGGLNKRERHNERKNADYQNEDIVKGRAALNVHFKQCEGGYAAAFDRMVSSGAVSLRGLGKDPYIVDELVFDVNSAYFENHGGYEYAKAFFEEAYRCAVEEIGGEEYVLSAVLHADERNKALSEKAGHDVYHYHLHVAYVPVVDKEIKWSKRCKDPALVGTTREVIKQVSHSKKWPKHKQLDDNGEVVRNAKGKAVLVNAYSLLQDHFYQHMREAGFRDFERGERGSSAEHLDVLDYKIQQDKARAAALEKDIKGKEQTAAALDQQAAQKQQQLVSLEKKTAIAKKDADAFLDIDAIGKPALLLSGFHLTTMEMKKLKRLAKEGQQSRAIIADLRGKNEAQATEITGMKQKLKGYGEGIGITAMMRYNSALQRAPRRLADTVSDIMRQPPERTGLERTVPQRKRGVGLEIGG